MAQITFEGYVQERNGRMLRVSEEYRRKDQAGNWGNDGYGDFTVWLRDDDQQPEVQAGAIVLVSGDLRVKKSEKDGRVFTNLNVSFAKVGIVRTTQKYQGAQPVAQAAADSWSAAAPGSFGDDTSVPF